MRFASILHDGKPRLARITEEGCFLLETKAGHPTTMIELLDQWHLSDSLLSTSTPPLPLDTVHWLPPISQMEKIICIGANYAEHAHEMGHDRPELPVVFSKFPSAITRSGGEIILPRISHQVDYEAELVVVIGKEGKNISHPGALDHVFGYCCGNDISARDWQKGRPGGQWLLGKTFDTFAPIGPFLVTADEIPNPHQLEITLRLNGQTMQASNTRQMMFSINDLIAHLSKFVTLKRGDLIFTGTPAGVGAGRTPPCFLQPGDQLEVEIESLGILKNKVVSEPDASKENERKT